MWRALRFTGVCLLGGLCLSVSAAAQSFDVVKVAEGVYAGLTRGEVASNGAFIVNEDHVVVVDTHRRPVWARDMIAEIKKVTDKPVRYVINTHFHADREPPGDAAADRFATSNHGSLQAVALRHRQLHLRQETGGELR